MAYTYKRRSSLMKDFDLSKAFIDKIIKEIEIDVDTHTRYPNDAILRDVGYVLIDTEVFKDYLQYRRLLKSDAARKKLPPFVRSNASESKDE